MSVSSSLNPNPVINDDHRTVDIVARIKARYQVAANAEKRLAGILLNDLPFAASASITEIAERAEVSAPTITRLARALGYQGTKEFRFHLAQALTVVGAYLTPNPATNNFASLNANDIIGAIRSGAHAALELMFSEIDECNLEKLVEPLPLADQILVYGTGGMSSMAAIELQNRLFRLGLHVTAHTDPQLQRMSASVVTHKTVVIGFSLSGRARSVHDAISIAQEYGAHTIAITSADSPVAQKAHTVLPVTFKEGTNLYMPSMTRYALLACVDLLAMSTATQMGPEVLENLRRVRQSLVSQGITDPHFPIGD